MYKAKVITKEVKPKMENQASNQTEPDNTQKEEQIETHPSLRLETGIRPSYLSLAKLRIQNIML